MSTIVSAFTCKDRTGCQKGSIKMKTRELSVVARQVILKHKARRVENGGDSVIAWACMTASEASFLIFIDYVSHDGSRRSLQKEIQESTETRSANVMRPASNCIGRNFIMQQDKSSNHTATQQNFILAGGGGQINHQTITQLSLKRSLKGGEKKPQNKHKRSSCGTRLEKRHKT